MNRRFTVAAIAFALVVAASSLVFANGTGESGTEPVTLNLVLYGAGLQNLYSDIYDTYEAVNPNITIEWEMPESSDVLMARINAGQFPDAWMHDFMEEIYRWDEEGYLYDFTGQEWLDMVIPETLNAGRNGNKLVAIPNSIQGYGLIVNQDLFDQAGITELPGTLDELEAVCQQLETAGITPFETGIGDSWPIFQMYGNFFGSALRGDEAYRLNTGDASFTASPLAQADANFLRFIDIMERYSTTKALDSTYNDVLTAMATGAVAMIHQGEWAEAAMIEIVGGREQLPNLVFTPVPVSGNPADAELAINAANHWVVYNDGPNSQAAADLIGWTITDSLGMEKTAQIFIPPALNGPDFVGLKGDVARLAAEGKGRPWSFNFWPGGFNDRVNSLTQEYLLGDVTGGEFGRQLQTIWDDLK